MDGPWDVRSLLLYVTTPPALPMIALEQPAHPLGIVARQSGVRIARISADDSEHHETVHVLDILGSVLVLDV